MEPKYTALLALIVSALSLFVAIVAIVLTKKHNDKMRGLAASTPELNLLAQANAARTAIEDVGLQIVEHSSSISGKKPNQAEKAKTEFLGELYKSKIEALLNIFELACSFYVDKYFEPVRFRKLYFTEIKKLVDAPNAEIKRRLNDYPVHYPLIKQVYDEWNK